MEAKLKQTGPEKSAELVNAYQSSIDQRKSRLRVEAAERRAALDSMLKEDDQRRKEIL